MWHLPRRRWDMRLSAPAAAFAAALGAACGAACAAAVWACTRWRRNRGREQPGPDTDEEGDEVLDLILRLAWEQENLADEEDGAARHQVGGAGPPLADGSTPFRRPESGLRFAAPQGWVGVEETVQEAPDAAGSCWVARFMPAADLGGGVGGLAHQVPTISIVVDTTDTECSVEEYAERSREAAASMATEAGEVTVLEDRPVQRGVFQRELTWTQHISVPALAGSGDGTAEVCFCNLMTVRHVGGGAHFAFTAQLMGPYWAFNDSTSAFEALALSVSIGRARWHRGSLSARCPLPCGGAVTAELPSGFACITEDAAVQFAAEYMPVGTDCCVSFAPAGSLGPLLGGPVRGAYLTLCGGAEAARGALRELLQRRGVSNLRFDIPDDDAALGCEVCGWAGAVGAGSPEETAIRFVAARRRRPSGAQRQPRGAAQPAVAVWWHCSPAGDCEEGDAGEEEWRLQRAAAAGIARTAYWMPDAKGTEPAFFFTHSRDGFSFECDLVNGAVAEQRFAPARAHYRPARAQHLPELQVLVSGRKEEGLDAWREELLREAEASGGDVLWHADIALETATAAQVVIRTPLPPDSPGELPSLVFFATLVNTERRAYMLRWGCAHRDYPAWREPMEGVISTFRFVDPSGDEGSSDDEEGGSA